MRRGLAVALVMVSACVPQSTTPAPTPTPIASAQPSARPVAAGPATVDIRLYDAGLALSIPAGWSWDAGSAYVNRATSRLFLAANGPLDDLPRLPGNGDVDAAQLPSGRVVVEVESFCRLACQGPATETSFPLDWSAAGPIVSRTLPAGRNEAGLGLRWFDRPMFVVVRWADDAPAADIAAITTIAPSVRPDPRPPATGEYNGWAGLGPLANIPVGSVTLTPLPAGAILRPPYRTYDNVPFFVVRGKQGIYAFVSRPLFDERCVIAYDPVGDHLTCTVDGRAYLWTRFGTYLGPEPASNLSQHRVIVRDGQVWVRYVDDSLLTPSVPDEAAER